MKIRQLQCFVVLAEELNFTRAAKRLNMSQPPLSLQIQSLERIVGTELIRRTSRKMALTPAGTAFELRARGILAQHARAMEEIREIMGGQHGFLELGTTGSILRGGLADLLAQFCEMHPKVTVRIHEQSPVLQVNDLISRRMDVSFNRSAPAHGDLSCERVWREEMLALLPENHPLARRKTVSVKELRHDKHIILRPDSSDFAAYIMSSLTREGYYPQVSQQVMDAQSIPSLVVAGFGVSIVPAGIARLTSGPFVFRPIRPDPPTSDVFMVYHQHEQTPALKVFLQMVRNQAVPVE